IALHSAPLALPAEGFRIRLEDPGRTTSLVLVGMRDEGTPLGLLEDEREGIERFGRSHPGKIVGADIHFGLKVPEIFFAKATVDAVGDDDQIGGGEARFILDLDLEL